MSFLMYKACAKLDVIFKAHLLTLFTRSRDKLFWLQDSEMSGGMEVRAVMF